MIKKFVLIHKYLETGYDSIVAFSDNKDKLLHIAFDLPHYGSIRHFFDVYPNKEFELVFGYPLNIVKDECLINICKNVADYLSVGEYCMLKKSYFKSQAWFEKAKNSASLGAEIIENY